LKVDINALEIFFNLLNPVTSEVALIRHIKQYSSCSDAAFQRRCLSWTSLFSVVFRPWHYVYKYVWFTLSYASKR